MTSPDTTLSTWRAYAAKRGLIGVAVAVAVVLAATGPGLFLRLSEFPAATPHLPELGLIARETLPIRIHLGSAVAALIVGTALMVGVKGRAWHKRLGWTYAALMLVAAVSSFWIMRQNDGELSFIHALSGWTVVTLPMAVYFARRKNVARHRRMMSGLFFWGLILAGALAFLPGRLMWLVFFG